MARGWHATASNGFLWGEVEENSRIEERYQGKPTDFASWSEGYACEAGQEHQEDQLGGK